MIIDFNKIEETCMPKFKGGEGQMIARMFTDELGKIMLATVEPGSSIGLHTHEDSSEIIYVLEGSVDIIYDGGSEQASAGMCHYCPKGHSHSVINNSSETVRMLAIVPQQ